MMRGAAASVRRGLLILFKNYLVVAYAFSSFLADSTMPVESGSAALPPAEESGGESAAIAAGKRLLRSKAILGRYEGEICVRTIRGRPYDDVEAKAEEDKKAHDEEEDHNQVSCRYWLRKGAPRDDEEHVHQYDHAQVVVFFHGLGCSKYDFVGAVARLDRSWTLLALDWPREDPSSSKSERAAFNFETFDDLVSYAHAAIEGILGDRGRTSGVGAVPPGSGAFRPSNVRRRFALVGHSMGGKLATQYALRYPEQVWGLVNVEAHLHPKDPRAAEQLVRSGVADFLAHLRRTRTPADQAPEDPRDPLLDRQEFDPALAKWLATLESLTSSETFLGQARAIVHSQRTSNLWDGFLQLVRGNPKKVAFLYGEKSRTQVSASLDELQKVVQARGDARSAESLRIWEIPGAGHFPFFDNPVEFYARLNQFLSEAYAVESSGFHFQEDAASLSEGGCDGPRRAPDA